MVGEGFWCWMSTRVEWCEEEEEGEEEEEETV